MKKYVFTAITTIILSFGFINLAGAAPIFIDFEEPDFPPDVDGGNQSHLFSTAYGNIAFNGRIWNEINSNSYPDHTTDSYDGYFLKNTHDEPGFRVMMEFDFDVSAIDLFWLGQEGVRINGAVYDIDGNELDSGNEIGTGEWSEQNINGLPSPIRSIEFWTTRRWSGNILGNRAAIDDITITPLETTVPEPATMLLFSLGLAPLALRRKKPA